SACAGPATGAGVVFQRHLGAVVWYSNPGLRPGSKSAGNDGLRAGVYPGLVDAQTTRTAAITSGKGARLYDYCGDTDGAVSFSGWYCTGSGRSVCGSTRLV